MQILPNGIVRAITTLKAKVKHSPPQEINTAKNAMLGIALGISCLGVAAHRNSLIDNRVVKPVQVDGETLLQTGNVRWNNGGHLAQINSQPVESCNGTYYYTGTHTPATKTYLIEPKAQATLVQDIPTGKTKILSINGINPATGNPTQSFAAQTVHLITDPFSNKLTNAPIAINGQCLVREKDGTFSLSSTWVDPRLLTIDFKSPGQGQSKFLLTQAGDLILGGLPGPKNQLLYEGDAQIKSTLEGPQYVNPQTDSIAHNLNLLGLACLSLSGTSLITTVLNLLRNKPSQHN